MTTAHEVGEAHGVVLSRRAGNVLVLSALALILVSRSVAQVSGSISGDRILEHVDSAFVGIDDYIVDLDATVDVERLQVPPMRVTMYFKRPDKVHFESNGFALLPREGLALSVQRLRSRYTIEGVRRDTLDSGMVQVLTLVPKAERSRLQQLMLYVDPVRWTVMRLMSTSPDGRTMTANFQYQQAEHHWLPASLVVVFGSAPPDTTMQNDLDQVAPMRRPQLPRKGTITIRYSNYRINTGLSDEIFERPSGRSGRE